MIMKKSISGALIEHLISLLLLLLRGPDYSSELGRFFLLKGKLFICKFHKQTVGLLLGKHRDRNRILFFKSISDHQVSVEKDEISLLCKWRG